MVFRRFRHFARFGILFAVTGCAALSLGENLPRAILNQDDPAMVRDGAPSYLLLVDGLILDDTGDEENLGAGAKLYTLYGALFAAEPERARRLSERALRYGEAALCAEEEWTCGYTARPLDRIEAELDLFEEDDLPAMHTFGAAWLLWIKTHADDWNAVAALPKAEALFRRALALGESYDSGAAHYYLALVETALPPALGGRPEEARTHFERALELSGGQNLGVKVAYARQYARMLYDRELHDRLLREVLAAPAEAEGFTLLNTLAKREAKQLLDSADDYF
jgi:tetratricopeptide (TPR) repeat protein